MVRKWYKLLCKRSELQLTGTLNGGQSFRWTKTEDGGKEHWIGVFSKKVWVLQQQPDCILYQVYEPESEHVEAQSEEKYNKLLSHYFHLDINLSDFYEKWSERDPHFKEAAKQFYGIRILRQDTTENIFSFICSQNNHITRITSMVEKLAKNYGEKICELNGVTYCSFPNVEALAGEGVEQNLRENSFGYRAKYISNSAKYIVENGGNEWLENISKMDYPDAKKNLIYLMGIGAKVADCICLMSLGHLEAIPVDTHIYQIAARLYMPKLPKQKTVTEKIYKEIGDNFRELYGPLAGWAHTVLFCADLKKFQEADQGSDLKKHAKSKKQKTK